MVLLYLGSMDEPPWYEASADATNYFFAASDTASCMLDRAGGTSGMADLSAHPLFTPPSNIANQLIVVYTQPGVARPHIVG
jgi:hypothetical protein